MKSMTCVVAMICMSTALPAAGQGRGDSQMRFQALDRNRDGIITRDEWSGNDRSFRNHDWNGDGKLSGDEVRVGAARPRAWDDRNVEDSIGLDDDWTAGHFRALDHNRDSRLSRAEWHSTGELFARIDRNHDGFISQAEFTSSEDDDREDRFADLDVNNDGRLSRAEWHGAAGVFDALDLNRDGTLTRAEAVGTEGGVRDGFKSVDVNNDGVIGRDEWHWNAAAFDRLDANRDGRLSRGEFETAPAAPAAPETAAYRAGYERGRQEGIQAGKEDKPRGWDLEGQRELETADSGYEGRLGPLNEYQAGYRAGFRRGYREGFGPRGLNP
jgi:Ca2+-binding EF-hand superfamily protein